MKVTVRKMGASDRAVWADMRIALWSEETPRVHAEEIDRIIGSEDCWAFIAEAVEGTPTGFAEVAIRKYANGCESQPVPFLEAIWVNAEFRRQGIGTRLIEQIEAFLTVRGFHELGSDTQIENHASQAAHRDWGFAETERVVYFRKSLDCPRPLNDCGPGSLS
jgi:aminoglycoside 6'-N-acetyltransferase I